MNTLANFISKAKGLTKNPLGIIALFISLIYGFACLVLGTSLKNLQGQCERLPLIWFIIIFPILILIAFTFLVVYHHEKLYAPSDFTDEKNFVKVFRGSKEIAEDLESVSDKIKEMIEESQKSGTANSELLKISEQIERIKEKTEQIPINALWQLNHWGSSCASIKGDKMIFTGTSAKREADGSNIDLINFLEIGKTYEISCFAKSDAGTTAMFQLWCHDNSGEPNGVTITTQYKTPSVSGEIVKLNFTAQFNRNIRIHLQYKPGIGKIEISDVKVKTL